MATDAQISEIDVLSSFVRYLSDFSEAISSHSNSFTVLMTEKLSELDVIERKAEEMYHQIVHEHRSAFHDFASTPSDDLELKRSRLCRVQEAARKEYIAQRCYGIIHQQHAVARNSVYVMIDKTKQFHRDTHSTAEQGVLFLKKSKESLEQYKSNSNQV